MNTDGSSPAQYDGEMIGEIGEESGKNFVAADKGSSWTTTKEAAEVLGVSRRMVQEYVRRGELEAFAEGEGVSKRYYVSIDSLKDLQERRRHEASDAPGFLDVSQGARHLTNSGEGFGETGGEVLIRLIERLEARAAEAADLRARLELTTQAESTLRQALERERERANRLEAELQKVQRGASPAPREAPGAATEGPGNDDNLPPEAQRPAERRSWLARFFFGP